MRTVLKLSIFVSIITLITAGCQKTLTNEDLLTNKVNSVMAFNAAFVKEWYYGVFKKSAEWQKSSDHGKKLPDWKGGIYYKIGDLEVVEFPLQKEKTKISMPSANPLTLADRTKLANACLTKISFIKNAENNITVREVDYIPDWQYLQKKQFDISNVAYGKKGDDFTGKMVVKDWKGVTLSIRLIADGQITQIGKIKKSDSKLNNSAGINNTENVSSCTTFEFCIWQQDCVVILTGDVMGQTCGEWYNTFECWTEEYCEGEEEEDPCTTYGVGCNGGGGNEQCDPTLVSPQEQEFNQHIMMQVEPITIEATTSVASSNPISGTTTWIVAKGLVANWQIKANTQYSYYHYTIFNVPANTVEQSYDLFNYQTVSSYYTGSNTFITSTWTQTSVLDQVINNNSASTQGKTQVIGTIKHVANVALTLPYCNPLALTQIDDVEGSMTLNPR